MKEYVEELIDSYDHNNEKLLEYYILNKQAISSKKSIQKSNHAYMFETDFYRAFKGFLESGLTKPNSKLFSCLFNEKRSKIERKYFFHCVIILAFLIKAKIGRGIKYILEEQGPREKMILAEKLELEFGTLVRELIE